MTGQGLTRTAMAIALAALLAACATSRHPAPTDTATVTIKGQLTYRERIALPPNAVARVSVRDTSRADGKAPLIGDKTLQLDHQQVPIAFQLAVPRTDLKAHRQYSLQATIRNADGHLLWTTDSAHRVDRDKAVNNLGSLRLVQAGQDNDLAGTQWVVEDIAGGGIIDSSRATLDFGPDGQLSGRASCNRYTGHYQRDGQQLEIARMAMTMMACAPALNKQEQRFSQILRNADRFEINDRGKLIIHSTNGKTLEARAAD